MSVLFSRSIPAKGKCVKRKQKKLGHEVGYTAKTLGVLVLLTAIFFLLLVIASPFFLPRQEQENSLAVSQAGSTLTLPLPFFLTANSGQPAERPLFPLSVIPRGVVSAQELKTALAHDPVAASHYAGFAVAKSHIVMVQKDRAVFVSYRRGNRIYWTKNRMWLRRGETLISDGRNSARTRCGNRISEVAALPIAAEDPSEKMLDQASSPVDPPFDPGPMDFSPMLLANGLQPLPPGSGPSSTPPPGSDVLVPPIPPIFCCGGGDSHPPSSPPVKPPVLPPVSTPEPETWLLLISGVTFFCLFRKK
jgi:hypothetical protein